MNRSCIAKSVTSFVRSPRCGHSVRRRSGHGYLCLCRLALKRRKAFSIQCHAVYVNGKGDGFGKPADGKDPSEFRSESEDEEESVETTEEASRRVLEWDELCRQIACFASTPMGAAEISVNGLHFSSSREETELLVEQTAEAMSVPLSFDGIYDIGPGLNELSANERYVFSPEQLSVIGTTIQNAARMYKTLSRNLSSAPIMHEIGRSLQLEDSTLLTNIQDSIRASDGFIFDGASEDLARSRAERKQNAEELQSETEKWAQKLFKAGVCERPIVVFRRNRRCIPIKNGRQGDLPKGSVRLAQSATGRTVYMEPEPILAFNNQDILLQSQIRRRERRVVVHLSRMVAKQLPSLKAMMHVLKLLDIINARARHAEWSGGVRPRFLSQKEEQQEDWQLCVPGAVHPLLLEQALDPLPEPPSVADEPVIMKQNPLKPFVSPLDLDASREAHDVVYIPRPRPQPLELTIPRTKTVIALTGPNTGGKTASLKTLGLCVLMAKSGVYIPVEVDPTRVSIEVHMKWFDKVLADIGDSQSLQQSLSTFSGHVRRITNILDEVCPSSLVLLDEIGTGTDPTEGAALAAAVLTELSEIAGLTVATTHHAEIKELADANPLFLNASMEFNASTLKPTYRLIWGSMGQSNALDICSALNFDPNVVNEARNILQKGILQAEKTVNVEDSLKEKLMETLAQRDALVKTKERTKTKLTKLEKESQKMKNDEKKLAKELASYQSKPSEAEGEVDWILNEVREGSLTFEEAETCLQELLERAPNPDLDSAGTGLMWYPEFGEIVKLRHLGGRFGKVLSKKRGKMVKLECKSMTMDVPIWYIEQIDPHDVPAEFKKSSTANSVGYQHVIEPVRSSPEIDFDRVQTESNTLDLSSMHVEDAIESLRHAINTRSDTDVLFVKHGLGNRVRAALHDFLKRTHRVRAFRDAPQSAGGCTIVCLWE